MVVLISGLSSYAQEREVTCSSQDDAFSMHRAGRFIVVCTLSVSIDNDEQMKQIR